MSKAAEVRALLALGEMSTAAVAAFAGCSRDYVRAVAYRVRCVEKYGRAASPNEHCVRDPEWRRALKRRHYHNVVKPRK